MFHLIITSNILLKITEFKISPAAKASEHFASLIYRIHMNYISSTLNKNQEMSVILKTEPFIEGVLKDRIGSKNLFKTEMKMYSETLPNLEKLFKLIGEKNDTFPRLLYHSNSPAPLIVLEDVSPKGFYNSHNYSIEFKWGKCAFEVLGQLHALSMILHQQNKQLSEYQTGLFQFNLIGDGLFHMVQHMLPLIEKLKNVSGYQEYVPKLEQITKDCNTTLLKTFTANVEEGYNVLNHGDFHAKNMMFKNMDSEHPQITLLDFQFSIWGSPAIDVLYAKYFIAQYENRDELVEVYYREFSSTLEKLHYSGKIPSFDDLLKELDKNCVYEILLGVYCAPILLFDMSTISLNDFFDLGARGDKIRRDFFHDKNVLSVCKKLIREFNEKGFL